jgi:hypothetical protein
MSWAAATPLERRCARPRIVCRGSGCQCLSRLFHVEAQACAGPGSQAYDAQSLSVGIDPTARDTEFVGELRGIDQSDVPRRLHELSDAFGHRVDLVDVERMRRP